MKCTKCGNENQPDAVFCDQCGARLAATPAAAAGPARPPRSRRSRQRPLPASALPGLCPQCGAANTPGEMFCGECGAPLEAPAPEAAAVEAAPMLAPRLPCPQPWLSPWQPLRQPARVAARAAETGRRVLLPMRRSLGRASSGRRASSRRRHAECGWHRWRRPSTAAAFSPPPPLTECPSCGAAVTPDDAFCEFCGAALVGAAAQPAIAAATVTGSPVAPAAAPAPQPAGAAHQQACMTGPVSGSGRQRPGDPPARAARRSLGARIRFQHLPRCGPDAARRRRGRRLAAPLQDHAGRGPVHPAGPEQHQLYLAEPQAAAARRAGGAARWR